MDIADYLERERGIRPNEQQRRAVTSDARHILLLAVPGSGKTTVLAARLADRLMNRGSDPARMLNLTFNRETALEMERRFRFLFGPLTAQEPALEKVRFSTLHSFCFGVLRRYASVYRRELPRLLAGGEQAHILRELYRELRGEFLPDDLLETMQNRIGYAKNRMLPRGALAECCPEIERFDELFSGYESRKKEAGRMDFDDMLSFSYDILCKCSPLLEEFCRRCGDISLDEAQDTSPVQFRILQLLSRDASSFWVGDEDQSIYGFRGACPDELLSFEKDYPGGEVIKMEQNYRAGPGLTDSAGCFIRQNKKRYDKAMRGEGAAGAAEVLRLSDCNLQYRRAYELLTALPPGKTGAALYRNNDSALPLIRQFYDNGGEFFTREQNFSFFASGTVRDLTSYFVLADDSSDSAAFSKIYWKLGYSAGVNDYVRQHVREWGGVFDCILSLPSVRGRQRARTEDYRERFPQLAGLRPAAAIGMILGELNYQSWLDRMPGGGAALCQKLSIARSLAEKTATIYEFLDLLEKLRQDTASGRQLNRAAPITLSTIHSAKGMEFDLVVILDLLDGILPDSGFDDARLEDDRRLFYVAATRAKEKLVLFEAGRANGEPAYPSPFIRQFCAPH